MTAENGIRVLQSCEQSVLCWAGSRRKIYSILYIGAESVVFLAEKLGYFAIS